MASLQPRYTKEEFARRGQEIYERQVRPQLAPSDGGKYAAIDVESGIFEVDVDDFTATERVLQRNPEAQIWLVRVGHPATYRIGSSARHGDGARSPVWCAAAKQPSASE